jgi:hypothetical protein
VDAFLRGRTIKPQVRVRKEGGFDVKEMETPGVPKSRPASPYSVSTTSSAVDDFRVSEPSQRKSIRIYPYGVSKDRLTRAIHDLKVAASIARTPKEADVVLTLKAQEKRQPRTLKELEDEGLEVSVLRSNTVSQMKLFLQQAFGLENQASEEEKALNEAQEAIDRVMTFGKPVELSPQNPHVRRLQHVLIEQHGLGSQSRGEVPWRRVVVIPTRG